MHKLLLADPVRKLGPYDPKMFGRNLKEVKGKGRVAALDFDDEDIHSSSTNSSLSIKRKHHKGNAYSSSKSSVKYFIKQLLKEMSWLHDTLGYIVQRQIDERENAVKEIKSSKAHFK